MQLLITSRSIDQKGENIEKRHSDASESCHVLILPISVNGECDSYMHAPVDSYIKGLLRRVRGAAPRLIRTGWLDGVPGIQATCRRTVRRGRNPVQLMDRRPAITTWSSRLLASVR